MPGEVCDLIEQSLPGGDRRERHGGCLDVREAFGFERRLVGLDQDAFGIAAAIGSLVTLGAHAAVPGITGTTFNLSAGEALSNQPDGLMVYSWGYGCSSAPSGFAPAGIANATCPSVQLPGPTLIVHEGDTVTVNLTNNLPAAAGSTSIYFYDPNGIRLEASSAPAQGDEQRIMANRSQTKDRVRAEIATLCDDPEWIERAIACFKD